MPYETDLQRQEAADQDFLENIDNTEPWDPLTPNMRPRLTPEERREASSLGADAGWGEDSLTAQDIENMSDEHFLDYDFISQLGEEDE